MIEKYITDEEMIELEKIKELLKAKDIETIKLAVSILKEIFPDICIDYPYSKVDFLNIPCFLPISHLHIYSVEITDYSTTDYSLVIGKAEAQLFVEHLMLNRKYYIYDRTYINSERNK